MENLTQHAQLIAFIDANEKKAKTNLVVAVLLSLLGIALLLYFLLKTKFGDDIFSDLDVIKVITLLIVILLLELPALFMAWAFGSASDQAQKFRKELIKLRDLDNAIELSNSLRDTDITDSEKDIRCRIVKTLLDKYAN